MKHSVVSNKQAQTSFNLLLNTANMVVKHIHAHSTKHALTSVSQVVSWKKNTSENRMITNGLLYSLSQKLLRRFMVGYTYTPQCRLFPAPLRLLARTKIWT